MNGRAAVRSLAIGCVAVLSGCGASDPSTWEKCAATGCSTAAESRWDVIADGGQISGSGYDFVGPPDPYLCLTLEGSTRCSHEISDNAAPRWNDLLFGAVEARSLVAKPLSFGLWDSDTHTALDPNDSICGGTVTITAADLEAGGIRFECSRGSAAFRFHYVR